MAWFIRLALVSGLSCLCACNLILDIPDDPVVSGAGMADGGAQLNGGPWSCVDSPLPPPPVLEQESVPVAVRTCSFFAPRCSRLINGLTGRLCAKLDAGCRLPEEKELTQDKGTFYIDVPTLGGPFDGYLAVFSESEPCYDAEVFGDEAERFCGLLPDCDQNQPVGDSCLLPRVPKTMLFFNPPVSVAPEQPLTVPVIPMVSVFSLLAASGTENADSFDLEHGIISATIEDCNGAPAPGIRLEINRNEDSLVVFYSEDGVPNVRASQTDISGVAGVTGVGNGYAILSAHLEDGRKVAEASVLVEGLAVSHVLITPRRSP